MMDKGSCSKAVFTEKQVADNHTAVLRCAVSFIKELCALLKLQLLPQSTALVYLHRFVHVQGLDQHDLWTLGCACVFLAAKVEEDMRKLDAVADAAQKIHDFSTDEMRAAVNARRARDKSGCVEAVLPTNNLVKPSGTWGSANNSCSVSTNATATNGAGSKERAKSANGYKHGGNGSDDMSSERYMHRVIREKVLLCERVLLHSLSFDVSVTHAQSVVVKLLNKLRKPASNTQLSEYRLAAWMFINDGLYTDLCVRFHPEEVAAASVLMALGYLKEREEKSVFTQQLMSAVEKELEERRLGIFDLDRDRLESIFRAIYSVYEPSPPFLTHESLAAKAEAEAAKLEEKGPKKHKKIMWCSSLGSTAANLSSSSSSSSSSSVGANESISEPSSKKMHVE